MFIIISTKKIILVFRGRKIRVTRGTMQWTIVFLLVLLLQIICGFKNTTNATENKTEANEDVDSYILTKHLNPKIVFFCLIITVICLIPCFAWYLASKYYAKHNDEFPYKNMEKESSIIWLFQIKKIKSGLQSDSARIESINFSCVKTH